jgi:hypothetical protein
MAGTLEVRTMPRDVVCTVCKGPARNACTLKIKGRVKIAGFLCDAHLAEQPHRIKRI